jgi:hypothetical protein
VIATLRPDSLKGYTIGDPLYQTHRNSEWRLDDERNVYPFYEKMLKAGLHTLCIHKGLLPADYLTSMSDLWRYATVWDVGKAARDWPQINFVIYHSAMRPFIELPDRELAQFEATGRFDWVSDLADIPAKFGVRNVYAELGTCFEHLRDASEARGRNARHADPRHGRGSADLGHRLCLVGFAAVADRGVEAARNPRGYAEAAWLLAARCCRRAGEVRDLCGQCGAAVRARADGGESSADVDRIVAMRDEHVATGGLRSNLRYGYVAA